MKSRASGNYEFPEPDVAHVQKMEALARLASGISHDYNNLLTVILGHVDLMMDAPDPRAVAESAAEIRATVFRGADISRQLMAFSQRTPVAVQIVDLNDVVIRAQPMLKRLAGDQIALDMEVDPRAPMIHADIAQLERLLTNLTLNARDAMPSGGTLRLSTKVLHDAVRTQSDGNPVRWARLSVDDSGAGMDEKTKARIFEPFFTTKSAGEGKGLGLATAYGIVTQAGGRILVRSAPGSGTTFEMVFPAV